MMGTAKNTLCLTGLLIGVSACGPQKFKMQFGDSTSSAMVDAFCLNNPGECEAYFCRYKHEGQCSPEKLQSMHHEFEKGFEPGETLELTGTRGRYLFTLRNGGFPGDKNQIIFSEGNGRTFRITEDEFSPANRQQFVLDFGRTFHTVDYFVISGRTAPFNQTFGVDTYQFDNAVDYLDKRFQESQKTYRENVRDQESISILPSAGYLLSDRIEVALFLRLSLNYSVSERSFDRKNQPWSGFLPLPDAIRSVDTGRSRSRPKQCVKSGS